MIDWDTFKAQLQTDPGKVLKSVILLTGCFLLIWLLVVMQSNSPEQQRVTIHKAGRLDSLQLSSDRIADSIGVTHRERSKQNIPNDNSGADIYVILPIVLILFVITGLIWYWMRSEKWGGGGKKEPVFTTIATQQLPGGQQRIMVVKLNAEYWVMATGGGEGVSLLHRYSPEEWKTLEQKPLQDEGRKTFWQSLKKAASQQQKRDL